MNIDDIKQKIKDDKFGEALGRLLAEHGITDIETGVDITFEPIDPTSGKTKGVGTLGMRCPCSSSQPWCCNK